MLSIGPASAGLRVVLAVRGGLGGVSRHGESEAPARRPADGPVLGSLSRDTLSALGPAPLAVGDALLVGPGTGLAAVAEAPASTPVSGGDLVVPVQLGPHDALLGEEARRRLLATTWRVRPDSDRVGVRLDGAALPVPKRAGSLPSAPMVPGAIQVPPSGLPVVFGPDHPTTGGYPVIAVVTRAGLDLLAQAGAGTSLHLVDVEASPAASGKGISGPGR